jgi:type I restriction enzyme S subunit
MTSRVQQKLGDICLNITDGKHGDCQNQDNSGFYFISSKDVFNGSIHYEDARQITEDDFLETNRRTKLEVGDILITNSGTIGRMALIRNDEKVNKTTFQKSVAILKPNKEKIDNIYLYYLLLANFKRLVNLGGGAAQHNLLLGDLRKLELSMVEIPTQSRIASVLSFYDGLIENNERRIKVLEDMVQRLYTEWFIKFKFPGHEKIKIIDSPLGNIPEGWNFGKLGDKILIKKGQNITKKTILSGEVPVIAGGIGPAYFHNQANTNAPVITISASGANAGFMKLHHVAIWASDCSFVNQEATPFVLYYYLLLANKKAEIVNLQRGAAQPHVYPKDLKALRILHAPDSIIKEFEDLILPFFKLIANLQSSNLNLVKTRDLLIPQLVTGKRELRN